MCNLVLHYQQLKIFRIHIWPVTVFMDQVDQ